MMDMLSTRKYNPACLALLLVLLAIMEELLADKWSNPPDELADTDQATVDASSYLLLCSSCTSTTMTLA